MGKFSKVIITLTVIFLIASIICGHFINKEAYSWGWLFYIIMPLVTIMSWGTIVAFLVLIRTIFSKDKKMEGIDSSTEKTAWWIKVILSSLVIIFVLSMVIWDWGFAYLVFLSAMVMLRKLFGLG